MKKLVCGLMAIAMLGTVARASTDSADAWQRHREALQGHPDLVRYYTFEDVTPEKPAAAGLGDEREPMTYGGKDQVRIVDGSVPGNRAVHLDADFFQAKPIEVSENGFTVEMRFRTHGPGSQLGNGRTNGMLFAQGDGYWQGFRVWTSYPDRRLRFELGRPKPDNAFGMTAPDLMPDGVWHHVAAVWDGREMRLYLNGILFQSVAYPGPYSVTTAPLKIGYANAGIGSVKMDVDEVAVYRRGLSPVEILQHAYLRPQIPAVMEQAVRAGTDAVAAGNWAAAGDAFAKIVHDPSADASWRAVAHMMLARSWHSRNRNQQAVSLYAAVFDDDAAPQQLREIAARMCLPQQRGVAEACASAGLYRHLLEQSDFTADEQVRLRLALAECLLGEEDAAGAREQYAAILRIPTLAEPEVWNVRLQAAHTYLRVADYAAARAAYAALAGDAKAPAEVRGNAALCFAQAYARQGDYASAGAAYGKIAQRPELPAHFRQEARERIGEMERLRQGLAARDPTASRVKLPADSEPAVTLFVAPEGSDDNPGTQQQPFASLQRARDAIRDLKLRQGLSTGGVTVYVRGGCYRVEQTLEMNQDDSGTSEAPVIYRAFPQESPIFTGGVRLDGFQPLSDAAVRNRLDEHARGKVMQVDLRDCGVTDLGSITVRGYGRAAYPTSPWVDLYVDGRPMQLARWPNEGTLAVGTVHRGRFHGEDQRSAGEFEYAEERPNRWARSDDIWMFGAWGHLWAGRYVQVTNLDTNARRVTTRQPSTYGFRAGQPYYFLNVLEELDRPGEWYLDRRTGVLYVYPPRDLSEATVEFPLLQSPFVTMKDVGHVTLRGLTFELGRAEGMVIEGGANNLVAGCTFRRLGTNGVIIRGGTGHGLLGCNLQTLGAGGVRVAGGDRKTLTPGNHFVENCHIHDFSRVDRVYAPAVHVDGVGQRIAHNLFHDSPHHAMRVEGYEHKIEFNEIHSVVYEFDDQAGIDIYGNPAYRGLVIRHNFWHHIGSGHNVAGQAGIRLDDFISAVLVYGNVFYRCSGGRFGGVQIHGGKDNIVDNNLFVQCKYAISFSPWGQARWLERLQSDGTKAVTAQGGVDLSRSPHRERYPDLADMTENADRNFIWRNLIVDCGQFTVRDRGVNAMMDNHVFVQDPGFEDPENRDFTLPDDSPVFDRFGFRPIPFREIGLYPDEYRRSWPAEHRITPHYVREY